jgi:protein-S-isoprenylcysteine O-methyltransferase Ste14
MDQFERRLRLGTAISWLVPTVMALQGAWRSRRASGRRVGVPLAKLPGWALAAVLAPYVALFVRLWRPLPVQMPPAARLLASTTGAVLSLLGMALVIWGRITLGRLYNVSSAFGTQLYSDQELVTTGPFALVRHPMYLGALIAGVGTVLLYRTWTAVLILTQEVVFWVRAGREEQALAAEFGDTWNAYVRRVPSGVPVLGGCPRRSAHPPENVRESQFGGATANVRASDSWSG